MEFLSIQSFKYGLDGRRSDMTSQPGVLSTLQNGRVNSGGEIEKRKAFVKSTNTFPADTFGLEATSAGLVTFGSDAAPSGALPAGVTYVRLQHPTVIDGGSYDPTKHAMTSCFSCNFNGQAFVGAVFSDGRTFLYFNGVLVDQSRNGLVLDGVTSPQSQATSLARQINLLTGWSAVANVDRNGNLYNGSVIVKSPIGDYYTPVFSVNSSTGTLSFTVLDKDKQGVTSQVASASFKVINGTVGVDTFTVKVGGNTIATAVPCAATATLTASAIASTINSLTAVYGYTATTDGLDTVIVYYYYTTNGSIGNGAQVEVITTGSADSGSSTSPPPLIITFNPANLFISTRGGGIQRFLQGIVKASTTGGTAPYAYTWTETTPGSGNGITFSYPTGASVSAVCTFSKVVPTGTTVLGKFTCAVKDALGVTTSIGYSVSLSFHS